MTVLDRLRFLANTGNISGAQTVLLVQTGAPDLLARAVDLLRSDLPPHQLTVLLQRNMRDLVTLRQGVEYLDNEGSKRAIMSALRQRRFDAAFVLYTNQPGFWKLKLLPFLLGVPRIFAINEHMGWFPLSVRNGAPLLRHLASRAGSQRVGLEAIADVAKDAARRAAKPAIAGWLLAYERLASARAALRGGVRWKDESR